MWEDPIVAEVRRTREMLAAKFDYNVKAIFDDLRNRQASLGTRLVAPKNLVEPKAEAAAEPQSASRGSATADATAVN